MKQQTPTSVAILGLGPSLSQYVNIAKRAGARSKFVDEVWGINAVADVIACDRVFHMDDVRVQQIRADAAPDSNIAAMLGWMKTHRGPIYTSIASAEYPGCVAFPLEEVLNDCRIGYFNSTAAYAVALAIHLRVEKLYIFGCDYTYANAHHAEKGRACMEFWLGIAHARGIKLSVPKETSLMDACDPPKERYYGYDLVDVQLAGEPGAMKVTLAETGQAPTAAEIEERYDHARHPNSIVEAAAATTTIASER
jgi:hypothetical protein